MSLRPYHNPENLDESLVPSGYRLLYAGELVPQQPALLRAVLNPLWHPRNNWIITDHIWLVQKQLRHLTVAVRVNVNEPL